MSHERPLAATVSAAAGARTRCAARARVRSAAAILGALLLGAGAARATDYYLSPNGSDSNDGRDPEHPWKTWSPVMSRKVLAPGNRVRLLDGTYSSDVTGFLSVECGGSTGQSGAEGNPVTIEAVHERQAFVKGDGSQRVLRFRGCSNYVVSGLHIESADNPKLKSAHGAFEFSGSESSPVAGLVFRRNVVAHNNRWGNAHLVQLAFVTRSVVEENEFYYFHRHALLLFHSDGISVRRNYANSRGYPDIPGGKPSYPDRGDESYSCYPCSHSTFENNISEESDEGFTMNAAGAATDNSYYGNVSLGEDEGFRPNSRGDDLSKMPQNALYQDNTVVGVRSMGIHNRASKNTVVRHMSVFAADPKAQGLEADSYARGHRGDGDYRLSYKDSVAVGSPQGAYGVKIESPIGFGRMDWQIDHVWAYGFAKNFTPALGDPHITASQERDPGFGACRLWCPDGAACKGKASDGGDLGATVLYRYENGSRTTKPLWDPQSGAFLAAGARIAGVNDVAGQSLFDVHTRLNVNRNGCSFPKSYPSGGAPAASDEPKPTPAP